MGTRSITKSAARESGLTSFVVTSSIAAIRGDKAEGQIYTEADWNDRAPNEVARLESRAAGSTICAASKTLAEKEFCAFKEDRKPIFTMTAIQPGVSWLVVDFDR